MPLRLTPKQQRFVDEFLVDLNATAAYKRAGYAGSGNTAEVNAHRLLRNAKVAEAIQEARQARSQRTALTQDYVLERLRQNAERAMQAEPVLDREGNPTGAYVYQGSVANRALELLGNHLGLFKHRVEVSGPPFKVYLGFDPESEL